MKPGASLNRTSKKSPSGSNHTFTFRPYDFSCLYDVGQICRNNKRIIRQILYHPTQPFPSDSGSRVVVKEHDVVIGPRASYFSRCLQQPLDLIFHTRQFGMLDDMGESLVGEPTDRPRQSLMIFMTCTIRQRVVGRKRSFVGWGQDDDNRSSRVES